MENKNIRLDSYLWAIRMYKSRSLASDAIKNNKVKLIGIISNHFIDRLPVQPTQTDNKSAVIANIGIAIIEPAYKLQ